MTTYDDAISKARTIGREHGESAARDFLVDRIPSPEAQWYAENMTADWESYPAPDLSGEWADGYTPRDLCLACGVDWDTGTAPANVPASDLCDAYEEAFTEAVDEAVRAACEQTLGQ